MDADDLDRAQLLEAQALYHQTVITAYRTRAVNELFGSSMSPLEIARTIPLETIELLLLWKDRS